MRSRQSLIQEADRVFSLYIRNRGSAFGYNHCYTCSAYMPVEELQCGHFRPRRYLSTRWHPFNCWPQCNTCNVEMGGNLSKYKNKLVAQYGSDAVAAIYELSTGTEKITQEFIRNIIKEYKST